MKTGNGCPKCQNARIFHARNVLDRGAGDRGWPMSIGRSGVIHAREFGQLEAFICLGCGFTEFYVVDPRELTELEEDTGGIGVGEVTTNESTA